MNLFTSDFIFNSIDEGMIILDNNLIIKSFNSAAETITGWESEEVINKPCCDIMKSSLCKTGCDAKHTLQEKTPQYFTQSLIVTKDGRTVPIQSSTLPIKDEEKNIIGVVKMFSDLRNMYSTYLGKFQKLGLIGASNVMREVFQLIETVAVTNSNVIIYGKTGTGKELVANAIHNLSPRKDKPFVKVNCAALSDSLLETELFGHEQGAFTGAVSRRIGRFEQAHQGTIFLDEIAEISPKFQAELLRILQEGEFERVGSSKTKKVDVRVIVATNKELDVLVKQKQFRDDLYYRLNVFPIYLPTLKERTNDIKLLVEYFITQFNKTFANQKVNIASEALNILQNYSFPGNVRELKNIIEHAFIKSNNSIIEAQDFPLYLQKQITHNCEAQNQLKDLSVRNEVDHILQVIEECAGNKTLAAKRLGISRKTLYNKLASRS